MVTLLVRVHALQLRECASKQSRRRNCACSTKVSRIRHGLATEAPLLRYPAVCHCAMKSAQFRLPAGMSRHHLKVPRGGASLLLNICQWSLSSNLLIFGPTLWLLEVHFLLHGKPVKVVLVLNRSAR